MTWLTIIVVFSAILWFVRPSTSRRRDEQRLGAVSSQWLADHRQNHGQ
jgi:hypothetical protein